MLSKAILRRIDTDTANLAVSLPSKTEFKSCNLPQHSISGSSNRGVSFSQGDLKETQIRMSFLCICVCVCVYIYIPKFDLKFVSIYQNLYQSEYSSLYYVCVLRVYVHMCVCVCDYVCMCVCVYVWVCVYVSERGRM